MKIFFDTEFTGLQKDTDLISIGCISEDLKTFYGVLTDYDKTKINKWLQENVINNLDVGEGGKHITKITGTKSEVSEAFIEWLKSFNEDIEFVSDVCHYDYVLMIDLLSNGKTAFDIPKFVCANCYDINQDIAKYYNISLQEAFDKSREDIVENEFKLKIPNQTNKHNALYDAIVIKAIYNIIKINK